jgi:hypothetical protein
VIPQTHWAEDQVVCSVGHAGAEDDRRSEAKRHDNPGAQVSHSIPLARLVTADPSIGVIERDQSAGHERACDPVDL